MQYDLEERTAKFGEQIILFCKTIQKNEITKPLINQIIRSATSIGANYMEANRGSSKRDFSNKISICLKESNETKHWLRMMAVALEEEKEKCRIFWKEAHELTLIFSTILKSCKKSKINE
ncbi:MAG TPA: four helix bundle protein [bacterium]|nr:four helix bundle protein [bacterium]